MEFVELLVKEEGKALGRICIPVGSRHSLTRERGEEEKEKEKGWVEYPFNSLSDQTRFAVITERFSEGHSFCVSFPTSTTSISKKATLCQTLTHSQSPNETTFPISPSKTHCQFDIRPSLLLVLNPPPVRNNILLAFVVVSETLPGQRHHLVREMYA